MLAKEALSFIPDDSSQPVTAILGGWDMASRVNSLLPAAQWPLLPTSTGRDLKAAILGLTEGQQEQVLGVLATPVPEMSHFHEEEPAPVPIQPATLEQQNDNDDRQLKRWLVKALTITVIFIVCTMVVAIAVIGVKTGQIPDTPLVTGLISLAEDMLPVVKLIFGTN